MDRDCEATTNRELDPGWFQGLHHGAKFVYEIQHEGFNLAAPRWGESGTKGREVPGFETGLTSAAPYLQVSSCSRAQETSFAPARGWLASPP